MLRDASRKEIETKILNLFDDDSEVKFKPAKTKRQMYRNWSVLKATELVKQDARAHGTTVMTDWMVDGNRD